VPLQGLLKKNKTHYAFMIDDKKQELFSKNQSLFMLLLISRLKSIFKDAPFNFAFDIDLQHCIRNFKKRDKAYGIVESF
jgi:hypothetical protein